MTGWIIFAVIVALIAAPFFVPITLTAGLDDRRRDWSVRVGTLQVAPDGEVHFKAFRERWAKRLRPLKLAGIGLFTLVKWIFIGLFWVLKAVIWPFKTLAGLFRKMPRSRTTSEEFEDLSPEPSVPEEESGQLPPKEAAPPTEPEQEAEQPEPSGEARRGDPGFVREDTRDEKSEDQPEPEMPTESAPDNDFSADLDFFDEHERTGESEKSGESESKESGFSRLLTNITTGFAYLNEYGPLGKRILRAVFKFLGDCLNAFQFKKFDGRYGFGGDPAALGALLGWHHALLGSIHPRLPGQIEFVPAFDDEDSTLWGSLDCIVVIWPYRYVLATFRLITRLPLWGLWRAYRRYRRGELLPTASSGVSA